MAEEKKKGRGCLYAFGCLTFLFLGGVGLLFLGGVGAGGALWYSSNQLDQKMQAVADELAAVEAVEAVAIDDLLEGTVDEAEIEAAIEEAVEEAVAAKPTPRPAPAPKPSPSPAPSPAPAPTPVAAPSPAPAPAPRPSSSGTTMSRGGSTPNVTATGASVTLIRSGKRYKLPASVPAGTYDIEATFSDGTPVTTGKIRIEDGGTHSVTCRESMGICRGM
ncbi:MAG: hypothetical protein KC912_09685 [Proteobacteria bacterium]|nr:hypothetical protein [Pseudomonadota bacterium]